ncbi:MAG: hypothetical protein BM555_04540 [Crocinitomix sp. MedPE-SWsnd]|nr:MAG: hypothetical protein BM555_04540 [Crocinitomix sp. MedPE-SWsnd]
MEPTWENIKSLIVSQEQDGMMIKLKFQAEGQTTPLETMAVVTPDQDEIMKNAMKQAGKAAVVSTGISMASGALGGLVGGVGGQAVRAAGSAAGSAAASKSMNMDKIMQTEQTDEKTQAAIVTAFGHLSMYYKWENDKWVYQQPGA